MSGGVSIVKGFIPTTSLTNAAVKLYTALGDGAGGAGLPNGKAQVTSVVMSNLDTVAHGVFIYNVAMGGSPVNSNLVFPGNLLPGLTTWFVIVGGDGVEAWTMAAGDMLWAKSDANSVVNLTVSGREITG